MSLGYVRVKVKGLGFILWQTRHELYHVLLGLVWAWFLRERWNEFNLRWIWLAIIGSLVPDVDHAIYFFGYGRHDAYSYQVRELFRKKQWRKLVMLMANGHKSNTNLSYHNYFVVAGLLGLSLVSSFIDWEAGVILFGAMIIHYIFDVADDLLILGYVNSNWKRWGRVRPEH